MMNYKTVDGEYSFSFTEKKSDFIGHIAHAETEKEAIAFIEKIRSENRKATHNCYAYILRDNNISRHSDDGEPQGTAGVPIYDVIRKESLTDTVIVVTRYFGGILLGAGGLVRAYGKAASGAISTAKIKNMATATLLSVKMEYNIYGRVTYKIPEYDVRVTDEIFADDVTLKLYIREELSEKFCADLTDLTSGKVEICKILTEYYDFCE